MELTSGYATLEALMIEELNKLFDAEKQHSKMFSKLGKGAETEELKEIFEEYLNESKNQSERFDQIFKLTKTEPKKVICKPMRALIREEKSILENKKNSLLKDAALIGEVLKVINYLITFHQTLISQAKQLRYTNLVDLLEESQSEKSKMYKELTKITDGSLFKMGITSQIAVNPEPIKS